MAFCRNCGTEIDGDIKFCPNCGAPTRDDPFEAAKGAAEKKFNEMNDTEDYSSEFSSSDIETNRIISLFSYLGILVLIPIFGAKESPFAKFHISQGLNLLLCEIVLNVVSAVLRGVLAYSSIAVSLISAATSIIQLGFFILMIFGIINAVNGRAKELPVIGALHIFKINF